MLIQEVLYICLCTTLYTTCYMMCFSHTLSFRKQHEQLQAVIVRVLRPQQQKGQAAQVFHTDNRRSVHVRGTCTAMSAISLHTLFSCVYNIYMYVCT